MFTTKRLSLSFLCLASFALAVGGGCFHFKKNATPKENPALASEVEEGFKLRWVDKRAGELVAQGLTNEAARAQATEEFRGKYPYTHAAEKR
jgi:hypothetical protein